jgi:cold-inducible RNA-binding protein
MDDQKKLYVGNLNFTATDDELKQHFEEKEIKVSTVNIVRDKYTGRSRGFGFVELTADADMDKAIELLNETEFKGRKLVVNKARQQQKRDGGGGRFDSGGGGRSPRSW